MKCQHKFYVLARPVGLPIVTLRCEKCGEIEIGYEKDYKKKEKTDVQHYNATEQNQRGVLPPL